MTTVSIVTPCHNGARYLKDCIDSVFAQSFDDWEWLIVDDGSTDGSIEAIGALCHGEKRVRILRTTTRKGAATARNLGIAAASGRYIAFLDCDDLWFPEKLELQLASMNSEDVAFSWSSYISVNEVGAYIRTQTADTYCTYRDLLTKRAVIGCLTAIYDREQYGRQLMPLIRMGQDYGLFLRLLKIAEERRLKVRGLTVPLAKYRVHPNAMTRNKFLKAWYQWRLYRDIERLSFMDSSICFGGYVLRGIRDRM